MMQDWFPDAKFGIFVHWGIYAVGRRGGESWPMARAACSWDEYMAQMDGFDASAYDPKGWAELFKRAGAQYAVLTTKHHDGVTLFETKSDSPSIPASVGCGDLVGKYVDAIRDADLKVGLYFSHTDWTHPEHMAVILGKTPDEIVAMRSERVTLPDIWGAGKPFSEAR